MHKFLAAASSVLIQQHQHHRMKHHFYNIAEKMGTKENVQLFVEVSVSSGLLVVPSYCHACCRVMAF